MDALSDVLRVVGLSGGIFLEAHFTAPWCIAGKVGPENCKPYMAPPPFVMCFHFLLSGSCWAGVDGEAAQRAEAGDVILVPRNSLHRIGSDLRLPPTSPDEILPDPESSSVPRITHGGGGEPCEMICGFLGGDRALEPLIATLPGVLVFKVRDTPGGEWIEQSFRYGARELAKGDPGAATIMSKMSELLFVEAVRRYLAQIPSERAGFLLGLRDPAIGRALSLMHKEVAREWTAEDLADAVHLSRSAFAERFSALVGQPPMRYLTQWRMQLAAHKLREGRLSIAQIAYDIGYDSEAAFNRAFKREIGVPPATWRRRRGEGASEQAPA